MPQNLMREQFDGYCIDHNLGGIGTRITVQCAWSHKHVAAIRKHNVKVIVLSKYAGWRDSDISFLLDVPLLEGLSIFSDAVTDLSPLVELTKLKMLHLAACKPKTPFEFGGYRYLQDVFITWRDAYRSLFKLDTLTVMNIVDYPVDDLTCWSDNRDLRDLSISAGKLRSLVGIEHFPQLVSVRLSKCKNVDSLSGISKAGALETLGLVKCKGIGDLIPLSHLDNLRELSIEDCGDISSLGPLGKCKSLRVLQIAGSTTVLDGDMSELLTLPKLKRVLLSQRRHYSHRAEDLERK